jgi:DNA recombination protein RmuC
LAKTAAFTEASTLLQQTREQLAGQQETLRKEFEVLAARVLDQTGRRFTEQNRSNLDVLLAPLKEKIKDFEQKVDTVYKTESAERNTLKGEILRLIQQNQRISEQAENLAVALKGDTRQQGHWGEIVLEKVLESSGLQKDTEYRTQVPAENAAGERIKPDVVVYLPDEKHLIIDAKVSLTAYEQLAQAGPDDTARLQKAHVDSVRGHVKALGEKHYQTASGFASPDFVLMFMPIEASFSAAVRADSGLFAFAWERRIVIVSPSTLLATLRTVSSIWKQERQTRHALQIAEEGGKLYDKFVGFVEDLQKVGERLDETQKRYGEAMNKLHLGTGNLVRRAEKMRELGAKATKTMPPSLIERAE